MSKNYRLKPECRKNIKIANDYLTLTQTTKHLLISPVWCILLITIMIISTPFEL